MVTLCSMVYQTTPCSTIAAWCCLVRANIHSFSINVYRVLIIGCICGLNELLVDLSVDAFHDIVRFICSQDLGEHAMPVVEADETRAAQPCLLPRVVGIQAVRRLLKPPEAAERSS